MGYLEWVRYYYGDVKYDLSRGNLRLVGKDDLHLDLGSIEFIRPHEKGPSPIEHEIAKRYGIPVGHVVITYGATQALYLLFEALFRPGDEILFEVPNYQPVYEMLRRLELNIKALERRLENQWQIDLTEVQRRISRNTRAVILSNLHNPTGVETSAEKLQALAQIAQDHKALLISDEVFLDSASVSGLAPAVTCGTNTVSISSLSKSYGLPRLRFGWLASQDETLVAGLRMAMEHYLTGPVSVPIQSIALRALQQGEAILKKAAPVLKENLDRVEEWVRGIEVADWVRPPGGTICFLKLPPQVDDMALSNLLREKYSTLVAPGTFFGKKGFVRITFGVEPETLQAGLENLSRALREMMR